MVICIHTGEHSNKKIRAIIVYDQIDGITRKKKKKARSFIYAVVTMDGPQLYVLSGPHCTPVADVHRRDGLLPIYIPVKYLQIF